MLHKVQNSSYETLATVRRLTSRYSRCRTFSLSLCRSVHTHELPSFRQTGGQYGAEAEAKVGCSDFHLNAALIASQPSSVLEGGLVDGRGWQVGGCTCR